MTDGFDNRANEPIERELAELGRWVAFPPTPDLAPAVRARLVAGAPRRPLPRLTGWRPVLVVAAVIVLLALGVALLSATVRDTVADAFGVSGIRIEFHKETPTAVATAVATPSTPELDLGREVSLTTAANTAPFVLTEPDVRLMGPPDAVYLREQPDGNHIISFVYQPTDGLPAAAETGVGMLLMQFTSPGDVDFMVKRVMGDGTVSDTSVNGIHAYWIEGSSDLMVNDASGRCCFGHTRPTANVLLWQRGDITYRMESALPLAEALRIAESIGPIP